MTVDERRMRLAGLGGRYLIVVRALIEHTKLNEKEIADRLALNENTFQSRRKRIFAVLNVGSRLELFAEYHALLAERATEGDRLG